jgi:hypothetical protein
MEGPLLLEPQEKYSPVAPLDQREMAEKLAILAIQPGMPPFHWG